MTDVYPPALPCVGGPLDGDLVFHWRYVTDTYEVFQRVVARKSDPTSSRARTVCAWASELPSGAEPEGPHLGHYQLDFRVGQATWVPA